MAKIAEGYVPLPSPVSLWKTSSLSWLFSLLAVNCRPFQQMA